MIKPLQAMIKFYYLLRVSSKKSDQDSLNLFGGLSDKEKSFQEILKERGKALRAGYSRVVFPWNFIYHNQKEKLLSLALKQPESFILSIHKQSLKEFLKLWNQKKNGFKTGSKKPLKNFKTALKLQLILEDYDESLIKSIEKRHWNFFITIQAHNKVCLKTLSRRLKKRRWDLTDNSVKPDKKNLSKTKPLIYMSFPCSHQKHPKLFPHQKIYHFLKKDFYPPPPFDAYNLSIPTDLKLEPEIAPVWEKTVSLSLQKQRLASVILPAYNVEKELFWTLSHLAKQDLDKKEWEVIVVDDGSTQNLSNHLKDWSFLKKINFKLLIFPRQQNRTGFKDHRFRAGVARNLGVKQAGGLHLIFLDADILTPPHYLSSACLQLEKHPVIQHPRYHLIPSAPHRYQDIIKERHTYIKEQPYWEDFYAQKKDWNQKKLPWKYISTNTLCLQKKVFLKVGRFRKNYSCYGFEDTDLGYRLFQSGFTFKLNPINTYHLFRESEFLNQKSKREELLGISALSFFHNTHCLSAYEEFAHLIKFAY